MRGRVDRPAEDIAQRLSESDMMVELEGETSNLVSQTRDRASAGKAAPPEAIAKQVAARQMMVELRGVEPLTS